MERDERTLVARCLEGDQGACTALVEDYARMVGTVIWRTTGSAEEVEDLTQETFLRVFRALPYFDGRARLSTWIYTIAHRVTIDHLRRHGHWRPESLGTAAAGEEAVATEPLATGPDPETLLIRDRDGALIRQALEQLPPKYRLPLVYSAIAGLDQATIASVLGLPVATVKTHVFRGKQLLKSAIIKLVGQPHGK